MRNRSVIKEQICSIEKLTENAAKSGAKKRTNK